MTEDSGSDEDFCVDDDDDDSDYGKPRRRSSKGGRRVKPEKKTTPKPRIRASGKPLLHALDNSNITPFACWSLMTD